jgi:hypothetical protein
MDRFAKREQEMYALKRGIVSDIKEMMLTEKGRNLAFNGRKTPKNYNRIFIDNYGTVIVSGEDDERNVEFLSVEEQLEILMCLHYVY